MSGSLPNILLIITDQQRTDTLGFMGQTPCRTPNMDRIAHEGISFDRALCTSPLCLPSRASIFTGKYPHQINMMDNSDTLQDPPVLTDLLQKHGYYTAYAGKWHLEPGGAPKALRNKLKELGLEELRKAAPITGERIIDRWFDDAYGQSTADYSDWCEENGLPDGWPVSDPDVRTHRKPSMSIPKPKRQELDPKHTFDAWVTDIALDYLRARPAEKPFFIVAGYFGPHPPFLIPEPYYSMYDADEIPEPPNFGPQTGKPQANTTSYYHQLFKDQGESWEEWKKTTAVYWGYCTMMDDLVGRLLDELEAQEILDDTLVIFISDHGEMLGAHGLWHKMMPYREALRVPFLMRFPGKITPGIRSQANVSLIDIPPTLLALINESVTDMQGRDISPAFHDGKEFQEDAYRFSEHRPLGDWHNAVEWRLVTDNRYKYVWNQGDLDEFYDLQADPYELNNRIDVSDLARERQRLRQRLRLWMVETDDPLLRSFEGKI